jgi:hypothetical protein
LAGRLESPRVAHVLRSSAAGAPVDVAAFVVVVVAAQAANATAIRSEVDLPNTPRGYSRKEAGSRLGERLHAYATTG